MELTAGLMLLETALSQMFSHTIPLTAVETLLLIQYFGRILAIGVVSLVDMPGFNNPTMDGYAMRLADLQSDQPLAVADKAFTGRPFHGGWPAGICIRVATSVPAPADCEAVVMQEQTEQTDDGVRLTAEVRSGQNVRLRGEDIANGAVVFPTGTCSTTARLPALASLGITEVPVVRKVRMALFSTGDELQLPGQPLGDGQTYDTDRLTVHLMLQQLGCEVINSGIIRDDPNALRAAFIEVDSQADVVISLGGVPVGEADYTKTILEELGEITLWKLAIKPGKPFAFGEPNNGRFRGLPGNPVSAVFTFYQLVQPLLAKLSGNTVCGLPPRQRVCIAPRLEKALGRLDFQRSVLQCTAEGKLEVTTIGRQGLHIFSSLSQGDCFTVLERDHGNVEAGEWVEVESFNALPGGL